MNEYKLSPDELVAKAFRIIQSCQPGFKPNSKAEWVDAIKRIYKKKGASGLWRLQKNHPHLYIKQAGFSAVWTRLSIYWIGP